MFSEQWLAGKLAETDEGGKKPYRIISELPHSQPGQLEETRKPTGKREHKYNAKRKELDGITFASSGEAERYRQLQYQASLGIIQHDKNWLQVPFVVRGAAVDDEGQAIKEVRYVADFVYSIDGETVVEDFKGHITKEFKAKYKMFRQRYPGLFLWVNRDKQAVFRKDLKEVYDAQYREWASPKRPRNRTSGLL